MNPGKERFPYTNKVRKGTMSEIQVRGVVSPGREPCLKYKSGLWRTSINLAWRRVDRPRQGSDMVLSLARAHRQLPKQTIQLPARSNNLLSRLLRHRTSPSSKSRYPDCLSLPLSRPHSLPSTISRPRACTRAPSCLGPKSTQQHTFRLPLSHRGMPDCDCACNGFRLAASAAARSESPSWGEGCALGRKERAF